MKTLALIVLFSMSACAQYEVLSPSLSMGASPLGAGAGPSPADPLGTYSASEIDPTTLVSSLDLTGPLLIASLSGSWVTACDTTHREVIKIVVSGSHLTRKYYGFQDYGCVDRDYSEYSDGTTTIFFEYPDYWEDFEIVSATLSGGQYLLVLKNVSSFPAADGTLVGIFDGSHLTEYEPYLNQPGEQPTNLTLTRQTLL